ncbi:MAG: hypothetical protein ACJA01_003619, partial [Saprospiraceae bacterium]
SICRTISMSFAINSTVDISEKNYSIEALLR